MNESDTEAREGRRPRRWSVGTFVALGVLAVAVVAVAVVLVLGSRGDTERHVVDERAWRAAREAQGTTFVDWSAYRAVWADECRDEHGSFGVFVGSLLDDAVPAEQIRTDVRYACPDRLNELEQLLEFVGGD